MVVWLVTWCISWSLYAVTSASGGDVWRIHSETGEYDRNSSGIDERVRFNAAFSRNNSISINSSLHDSDRRLFSTSYVKRHRQLLNNGSNNAIQNARRFNNGYVRRRPSTNSSQFMEATLRRLRRKIFMDLDQVGDNGWSRDQASRTLNQLESALKAAVEKCNSMGESSTSSLDFSLPLPVLGRFTAEVASAVHASNLLSLLDEPSVQLNQNSGGVGDIQHAFFSWLVRALIDSSNDHVHSVTVVIHRHGTLLAPQALRNTVAGISRVHFRDVSSVVMDTDWYTALRQRNSTTLSQCDNGSSTLVDLSRDVMWMSPLVNCTLVSSHGYGVPGSWLLSVVVPVYNRRSCENNLASIEGAVKLDIDLNKVHVNQCSESSDAFADTHQCPSSTHCVASTRRGLKRGQYQCHCNNGYYFPSPSTRSGSPVKYFSGLDIESSVNAETLHDATQYSCLPCSRGCTKCDDVTTCDDDVSASRVIFLTVQVCFMAASVVSGVAIVRLRRSKVMKASFWVLLEVIVAGVLLLQSTVLLEYFDVGLISCLTVSWLRETGFAVVYGSLLLKVYRVLAEFQSRKAQRVLLRDKDIFKYLLLLIVIVTGYLVTWTVVTLDHTSSTDERLIVETHHVAGSSMMTSYCKLGWWHYVIEIGECSFLCIGVYLCYCIRSAPTFYLETKFISFAIFNELVISAVYYIVRHLVWSSMQPSHLFMMTFLRCHFTATVTLILVIVTKIWFTHRPPNDRISRRRTYSTSDSVMSPGEEQNKLGGESGMDIGEINLADMNPEEIRGELRRLYTQLQVYKTKSMRRDNPHISKRRSGRKSTQRRFSLQAFHYKNRLQQTTAEHSVVEGHDLEATSRTPEESTNSADTGQIVSQGCHDDQHTSPRTTPGGTIRKQ